MAFDINALEPCLIGFDTVEDDLVTTAEGLDPTSLVALDFETYYDKEVSIQPLGGWNYTFHPKADPYLLSVVTHNTEWVGRPEDFDWASIDGKVWCAHNAGFDLRVWLRLVHHGITSFDESYPSVWCDTAALAAYVGAKRSLDAAVHALFGIQLSKGMRSWMKGKTEDDARAAGRYEELRQYALDDSKGCYKIAEHFAPQWPLNEWKLANHTIWIGLRGAPVDKEMVDESVRKLHKVRFDAENSLPWMDSPNIKDPKPLSPKLLAEECAKEGIPAPSSLAQTSEECAEWEKEYGDKYPWVGAMRDYRRSNMLLTKVEKLRDFTRDDGRFDFSMKYGGAHTMRWAGEAGWNMQNQHRDELFGVNIRHMFKAPKGKQLVICDLSQIEPRVLAWFAGMEDFLDLVREGFSVYDAHARQTMGWSGGPLKDEDPSLYKYAKARVLGLGYQCGHVRFKEVARMMAGLELDPMESKKTVTNYRLTNRKITQLWRSLDASFKKSSGENFELELPSGRVMTYFNVQRKGDGYVAKTERGSYYKHFYGGKLTENLVQATARDVFAIHLLMLEEAGYEVLFHTHDEAVIETPAGESKDGVEDIMSHCPSWLEGCPIGAEAIVSQHYLKS